MTKKITMMVLPLMLAMSTLAVAQEKNTGSSGSSEMRSTEARSTDVSLRSVYTTSYNMAERSLPDIVKANFNNDWNSVELNAQPIQDAISKSVSSEQSRMPGVDQTQIRQQTEAAFSAALFQLKHNGGSGSTSDRK